MFPVRAVKQWRRTETVEQGYEAIRATGSQQGHRADSIDNMGNVIAFSLRFFIWGREDEGR